MLLSGRMLKDVANVNSFEMADTVSMTEGDAIDVYFQLIDKTLDLPQQFYSPAGRRYMPVTGSSLQVVVHSIDDAKSVTRYASQAFTNDGSIWKLTLLPTDQLKGTYTLKLTLTEPQTPSGTKATRGTIQLALNVESLTSSLC